SSAAKSGLGNIADPFGSGGRGDLDGARPRDGDDDDERAGGQLVQGGDRLVLDDAVLQFQVDLAGAGLVAGDRQVDGAGVADGAVDADVALGAEAGQRPHDESDDGEGAGAGSEGNAQRRQRFQAPAGGGHARESEEGQGGDDGAEGQDADEPGVTVVVI